MRIIEMMSPDLVTPPFGVAPVVAAALLLAASAYLMGRWQQVRTFFRQLIFRSLSHESPFSFHPHLERLSAIRDRRKLYAEMVQVAVKLVGAEGGSLLVRDGAEGLQVRASVGLRPLTFDVSEVTSFFQALGQAKRPVTREMLMNDPAWAAVKNTGLRSCVQLSSEIFLPLFLEGRLIGILNLARREGGYDRATQEILEGFTACAAIVIHNALLSEEVVRQRQQVEDVKTLKNQLLANVSHELRTPLTSIIGLSEMMAEGGDGSVNEEQLDHLIAIRRAGLKLLETVSLMVDLSKIEAKEMMLAVHKLDLRRMIGEIAQGISVNAATQLSIAMDQATPGIYGDEARLRQVFHHLLENAAKFTKQGNITIDAEKSGEMLKISVRDTGIGIATEKQGKIFDAFMQGDGSITREYQGLGLGLAISRRIVELHGGRLWLSSRKGEGSSFYLTLPLKPTGPKHLEMSATA